MKADRDLLMAIFLMAIDQIKIKTDAKMRKNVPAVKNQLRLIKTAAKIY